MLKLIKKFIVIGLSLFAISSLQSVNYDNKCSPVDRLVMLTELYAQNHLYDSAAMKLYQDTRRLSAGDPVLCDIFMTDPYFERILDMLPRLVDFAFNHYRCGQGKSMTGECSNCSLKIAHLEDRHDDNGPYFIYFNCNGCEDKSALCEKCFKSMIESGLGERLLPDCPGCGDRF